MVLRAVFFAVLFVSAAANASIKLVPCNGCSSADMVSAATMSQHREGSSAVAVVDFRYSSATKFATSLRYSEYGEPIRRAVPLNFNTEEQHDVELYLNYRNALAAYVKNFSDALYEPPGATDSGYSYAGIPGSSFGPPPSDNDESLYRSFFKVKGDPYQFLSSSYLRNDAYDYYMKGAKSSVPEILDSSLQAVEIPSGRDLDLYIEIVFYSSPEAVKEGQQNGNVKVVADTINEVFQVISAEDSDNNTIPLNQTELKGNYRFNLDKNAEIFLNYINLMFDSGDKNGSGCVVTSGEGVGDPSIYTYRCG